MADVKGRAFLEVLSSALHEDYRFPLLEIFTFLYVVSSFVLPSFAAVASLQNLSGANIAYQLTSGLLNVPLFVFVILIFKNIAYGLGSDIEKGVLQTYFSYPIKRSRILTAKLLSALGVAVVLFLVCQLSALYILAPDIIWPNLGTVLLTYAAGLSYPLIIAGVLLLLTLFVRRGGVTLVVGIILYFALSIASGIVSFTANSLKSAALLQGFSIISPQTAMNAYYSRSQLFREYWNPTFSEVALYIGVSYAIIAVIFGVSYYYFSRRLNL
ncbi:MAG: ABC transporter permease subunit [Candidatus Bathyarchaeota archaeon]|nr:ABC transporter permease subunit [Candidatus Bathyarchaeota archaeon]